MDYRQRLGERKQELERLGHAMMACENEDDYATEDLDTLASNIGKYTMPDRKAVTAPHTTRVTARVKTKQKQKPPPPPPPPCDTSLSKILSEPSVPDTTMTKSAIDMGSKYLLEELKSKTTSHTALLLDVENLKLRLQEETLKTSSLQTRLDSTMATLQEKTTQCSKAMTMNSEIPVMEESLIRVQEQSRAKSTLLADTEQKTTRLKAKIRDMTAEAAAQADDCQKRLDRQSGDHKREIAKLEQKIKTLTSRATSLQVQASSSEQALQSTKSLLANREKVASEAEAEIPALSRKLKQLATLTERLEDEKKTLNAKLTGMEQERDHTRNAQEAKTHMAELEIRELKGKCTEMEVMVAHMGKERDLLKTKIAKYKKKAGQAEATCEEHREVAERKKRECMHLNSQLASFRVETSRFESNLEELTTEASGNVERYTLKLDETERECRELRTELARAQALHAQVKKYSENLEKQKKASDDHITQLKTALTSAQDEIASLSSQMKGVVSGHDDDRKKLVNKAHILESTLEDTGAKLTASQMSCKQFESAVEDAQRDIQNLNAKNDSLTARCRQQESDLIKLGEMLEEKEEENRGLLGRMIGKVAGRDEDEKAMGRLEFTQEGVSKVFESKDDDDDDDDDNGYPPNPPLSSPGVTDIEIVPPEVVRHLSPALDVTTSEEDDELTKVDEHLRMLYSYDGICSGEATKVATHIESLMEDIKLNVEEINQLKHEVTEGYDYPSKVKVKKKKPQR